MDKEDEVHTHSGILHDHKKNEITPLAGFPGVSDGKEPA